MNMNKNLSAGPAIALIIICLSVTPLFSEIQPHQIQVPEEIIVEIKLKAIQDWPDDYSMQVYILEKQVDAYKVLYAWAHNNKNNEMAERIFRKAQRDWPGDYSMQLYLVKKEVEAAQRLYGKD